MNDLPPITRMADMTIRRLFFNRMAEEGLLTLHRIVGWPFLLKLAPAHYAYPAGTFREATRHGIRYRVDLSTYHGWMIYYHRSEPGVVSGLVRSGDTVLDIGGNVGEVALSCAVRTGLQGRVISFEPNPATFAALKVNRELNPDLPLAIENIALGDQPGEVSMVQPDGRNPGTATVSPAGKMSGLVIQRIPVTTLDAYVDKNVPGPIHLVKMDVEGYESFVLRGAEVTLRMHKPLLVIELCDQHQRMHGGSAHALVVQIRALGYDIFRLDGDGASVTDEELDGCSMDVVCRVVEK